MESVRQWAFSLCAAMVACGIAQMLVPKSSLEKMFSLVASVFFLSCLLSPLLLNAPRISIELEEYSREQMERRAARLSEVVDGQQAEAGTAAIEKIIGEKLVRMGIKYYSITIDITTNGQSEIIATAILDETHAREHDAIAGQLERELGIDVRLGYESAKEGEDD